MSLRNTWPVIIIRSAIVVPIFLIGCLFIVFTQVVGIYLFQSDAGSRQGVMNLTKTHFVILITFMTSLINPAKIAVTLDESVPNSQQFSVDAHGHLHTSFQPNSIFISNHQIYTDWLFLWFLNYTSRMSDYIYIILKDLSNIPVLGYGMKNYNFLFLSRKWEKDKIVLTNQLLEIDANARGVGPANGVKLVDTTNNSGIKHWPQTNQPDKIWPYELILFPEGTVPSNRTTKKSREYIESQGLEPLKHVLLPRVRGLYLALKELRNSLEVVYDVTIAYSNLKETEFGEDVFSLKRYYLKGYGPERINYFVRCFKIKDIPLDDEEDVDDISPENLKRFEKWLLDVWYEKDELMANFYKLGHWNKPEDKIVVGDFKLRNQFAIVLPYLTGVTALLLLRLVYSFIRSVFV
ncbi:putative acyltransferase CST26 [Spathaspora sp. JA1]|nr:putative acyltransferase CST26 [Spathaspora sp. JA1]